MECVWIVERLLYSNEVANVLQQVEWMILEAQQFVYKHV